MVGTLRNSDMFFFVAVTDHLVCVNQQIKGKKTNTAKNTVKLTLKNSLYMVALPKCFLDSKYPFNFKFNILMFRNPVRLELVKKIL